MARRKLSYMDVSVARRKIRKMPQIVKFELQKFMEEIGQAGEKMMKSLAPKDTGDLSNAISYKLSSDKLSVRIGILGKRAQKKAWYAHFIEWGTSAYRSVYTKISPKTKESVRVEISGAARGARPFMRPAALKIKTEYGDRLVELTKDVLSKMKRP